MVYLTNILFLVLGLIIGYPIGLWFSKKKTTDLLSSGTGRFGIVSLHNKKLWKDLHVEVEEVEVAGNFTKVILRSKIENGCSKDMEKHNWIQTDKITWFDSNSMKIRNDKLKKLGIKSDDQTTSGRSSR